jgi:hypothetical protein
MHHLSGLYHPAGKSLLALLLLCQLCLVDILSIGPVSTLAVHSQEHHRWPHVLKVPPVGKRVTTCLDYWGLPMS